MTVLFWLTIIIIFYTYFGYPLLTLFLSLFVNKKIIRANIEPNVTFLITAYNEEKSIRQKIKDTLSLDYPKEKLEILVVSDASSDNTENIVREFEDKAVKLFRVEGRVGKTEAQNQAIQIAKGEIIIFSDATTKYDKLAIRNLVRNYADPQVGAVSGRYRYFDPNQSQIGCGTIVFWDYENLIKLKQTQIKTTTGCCGCIYSVRKSLYVPLPRDIISDLVEPLKILGQGYRIIFEGDALAYEETCQSSDEEFNMRVRVISRGMRGILYVKHLLNPFEYGFIAFQLLSHKVLRWLIPIFLIVLYIANVFLVKKNIFYLNFLVLQTLFYCVALLGLLIESLPKKIKILSFPLYFCVLNAASLVAFIKIIMNKKDITWQPIRR